MPKSTPSNDSAIVPFGKYQGQPIETLLADQNYLQWVTSQPGLMTMLQARHPAVFNIITIGAPTTDDSPEHNKLQAMFLERDFQHAFLEIVWGRSVFKYAEERAEDSYKSDLATLARQKEEAEQEVKRWQPSYFDDESNKLWREENLAKAKQQLASLEARVIARRPPAPPRIDLDFECGYDLELFADGFHHRIELKPQMGDDFSGVLRQMKRNGATVLVIGSFESVSCTLEQVQGIFGERKIITLAQIQAIKTRGVWPPTNN